MGSIFRDHSTTTVANSIKSWKSAQGGWLGWWMGQTTQDFHAGDWGSSPMCDVNFPRCSSPKHYRPRVTGSFPRPLLCGLLRVTFAFPVRLFLNPTVHCCLVSPSDRGSFHASRVCYPDSSIPNPNWFFFSLTQTCSSFPDPNRFFF